VSSTRRPAQERGRTETVKRPEVWSRVWWEQSGLTAMLASLALALFVGGPVGALRGAGQLLFDLCFSLFLVSGVVAFSRNRGLAIVVAVAGVASLVARWDPYGGPLGLNRQHEGWLSIATLLILTFLVLQHVFRDGAITADRVRGAILAYLLLGLVWAFAYELVELRYPGAILMGGRPLGDANPTHTFGYFSLVTLTTLGYGDIVPVHPIARSLAVAEALIGQLYPAILIARLVSLQISSRQQGGQK